MTPLEEYVMEKIVNHLLFKGWAEEAMIFYVSLFENSKILNIERYNKEDVNEIPNSVKLAVFTLNGQTFMCEDSNLNHTFTFTPAISLYVQCKTENEINNLYENLVKDGKVFMEFMEYSFSKKYCWIEDRYGVSWQLNLVG
jgi:predicted 3-demethylubiquinone-9 3-methyltransferase (glyoxalase superfamily)